MYPTRIANAEESSSKDPTAVESPNKDSTAIEPPNKDPTAVETPNEDPEAAEDDRRSVSSWGNEESSKSGGIERGYVVSDADSVESTFGLDEQIVTDDFLPI